VGWIGFWAVRGLTGPGRTFLGEVAQNAVLRERNRLQQMVLPASDPSGPRTAFG